MEHTETEFDEQYHEAEDAYRQSVFPLHDKERRLQEMIRGDVSLSEEERQKRYLSGYTQIETEFEQLANDHGRAYFEDRRTLEKTLYEGTGDKFGEYLASMADKPDEKLPEILSAAQRSKQPDLARAVAAVAHERNLFGVFQKWADSEPETADALARLRSLPDEDRFRTRTLALKPPRADMAALTPTHEDRERARQEAAVEAAPREAFFGPAVPRQVGGRFS
jgi:hypothetical protein